MPEIPTESAGTAEEPLLHMHFPVTYAQFYLLDANPQRATQPLPGAPGESSAGILRTVRGGAFLATGLHSGVVDLTVGVSAYKPAARLDNYDDVVEASITFDTDLVYLVAWSASSSVTLPPLPAGRGSYRLRYHARGMDSAHDRTSDIPLDFFLLQIWPEPLSEPSPLKITSAKARNWLTS